MQNTDEKAKKLEVIDIAGRLLGELAALRHQIVISDSLSQVGRSVPFADEMAKNMYWPLINRYIYSSLAITLNKVMELYEKYQAHIPSEARVRLKDSYNEFQDLGIKKYRNDYCGHIQNQKTKKPITDDEVDEHLKNIVGNRSLSEIGQWIWDSSVDEHGASSCISGLLEHVANETQKSIGETSLLTR
ncbi:hypothetical protein [Microbulbifer sp. ANSA005]|uniref:hypothetical protein n=1 Tax=Microbulbifer sp. ANSA005 TaxID=3243362 RepID=UPI004042C0F5